MLKSASNFCVFYCVVCWSEARNTLSASTLDIARFRSFGTERDNCKQAKKKGWINVERWGEGIRKAVNNGNKWIKTEFDCYGYCWDWNGMCGSVEVRKELMIASSRAQMQTWKQSKQSVAQEQQRVNSTPTTTNASKQQSLRCQLKLLMKETASNETGKKVKSRQAHFCDKDYNKTTTTFQSLSYQKNLRFDPVRYRLSNAEEIEIWMEFNNICGQKEAYQTVARRVTVRKQIFGFWFVAWRCLPRGNLTVF